MEIAFKKKYDRILEILEAVAGCTQGEMILVGGTALAIFYLKHRISVDLDFVPVNKTDIKLKEALKGCLSRKGYNTTRATYKNQFIVNFDDTAIKIEVFEPDSPVRFMEVDVGNAKIRVALLDDLLKMKETSYGDRKAARDLFDIVFILRHMEAGYEKVGEIIRKHGMPEDMHDMERMAEKENYEFFAKVVADASKTGN